MIQQAPTTLELHSSDLTTHCLRSAQLRHEGKVIASYTTAMYRGALADATLCLLHDRGLKSQNVVGAVLDAIKQVERTAQEENRPLSDSVVQNKNEIAAEVQKVCEFYVTRFAEAFAKAKFIGCQLPIRFTINIGGEPFDFASHLDLIYRLNGALIFADWKWRDETPTAAFLSRYLQFGCYAYGIANGEVMLGDDWVSFAEWPIGQWIHLPNLKPYARNGADYRAGDLRDFDKIVRTVPYNESCAERIENEISIRVRMWRQGLFPTSPDPVACHLCESNQFCEQVSVNHENQ